MEKKMTARMWLALLVLYIAWGSTYLAIRYAVESLPPFLMAGTRLLVAGLVVYAWRRLAGDPGARTPAVALGGHHRFFHAGGRDRQHLVGRTKCGFGDHSPGCGSRAAMDRPGGCTAT